MLVNYNNDEFKLKFETLKFKDLMETEDSQIPRLPRENAKIG